MICSIDLRLLQCMECTIVENCECLLNNEQSKIEFEKLYSALTGCGFIQITNHDIDSEVIQKAFLSSKSFFSRPLNQKMFHTSKDKARRGYSPIATENFATLIGESDKPNDTVEKYRIGPLVGVDDKQSNIDYYSRKEAKVHFYPNAWQDMPSDFESNLTEYYRQMEILAQRLLRIIEVAMALKSSFFTPLTDKHTSILSLNYYPPLSSHCTVKINTENIDNTIMRVAEHTDVSMLTIVAQSILSPANDLNTLNLNASQSNTESEMNSHSGGGLEILDPSTSQWLSVSYLPEGLVVNVGDCLSDWSGGRLKSARHRVITRTKRLAVSDSGDSGENSERYSLAYFLAPNYDAVMQWPHDETDNNSPSSTSVESSVQSVVSSSLAVNYTTWRKARIKRALEQLHKKQ